MGDISLKSKAKHIMLKVKGKLLDCEMFVTLRGEFVSSLLVLLMYSCNNMSLDHVDVHGKRRVLKSNDSIPQFPALPTMEGTRNLMISSAQFAPCYRLQIDGCYFDLAVLENETKYLSTNDVNFKTPEGYRIGTKFSDLPEDLIYKLCIEAGWAYYCQLPSGWNLGFCEGETCTDHYPNKDSKVKWIFKR